MEYYVNRDAWNGYNMMGNGGFWGWIFAMLWLALIVLVVILITKYLINARMDKSTPDALEVLKVRYAKGEIDKKEFEEKKKALQ